MPFSTIIDPATIQAYRETEFRILGGTPMALRVGVACPELAALHRSHQTDSSAFITACNPCSRRLADDINAGRQSALGRDLALAGLHFIPGVGQHPCGQWPGEASFLVLGMALESARAMGVRYEQNAIIWNAADAVPQLILLR